jgi:heavy metal translocating P-type ATPase
VAQSPSKKPSASASSELSRRRSFWTGPVVLSIVTATAIALHLVLRYGFQTQRNLWLAPLILVVILGSIQLVVPLIRKLFAAEFGSDHLAGISIITSVILGEYLVAAIVVLMLSGGTALEDMASRHASSVLDALARRVPNIAHRKEDGKLTDVGLDRVVPGEILVVLPLEICPADGVVLEGRGKMNEAYLTGEPFEIAKMPGSAVLSGSVNGESALTIRVEKPPTDSRYAKIMRVMQATEQSRPPMRRLADKLGAWYTPIALALAGIAWAATGQAERFLAVVVVATPCPLLIAIPVAIIGAISLSARHGIIVKNPAVLEQIGRCRTIIFDKTGTLTYGKAALSGVICAPGFERSELLRHAASLERYSKHPLADAVIEAAQLEGLAEENVEQISERPGEGLRGVVGKHEIWLTSRKIASERGAVLPLNAAGLECAAFVDGVYAGILRFQDAPRKESLLFVKHLQPRHAVARVLIVSGDRDEEVRGLAKKVGIKEVFSAKSPEEKVEIVREESRRAPTLFLGDGINDAPAMQAATVGVAFGTKNEITAEAADAVVMETSLSQVDVLMHISRRMRTIAMQSAVGGMALSIVGMIAAAFGFLPPIAGAIAQEVIDLVVVLNAVRAALPGKQLTDF